MNQFGVGQDEFIFRMYSISLVAITMAAILKGDMSEGITFILQPGTYAEQQSNVPMEERSWSTFGKIVVMVVCRKPMLKLQSDISFLPCKFSYIPVGFQFNGFLWVLLLCRHNEKFWSPDNVDNIDSTQGYNALPLLPSF